MSEKRNRRTFKPEFKARVALELISGEATLAELSRRYEVSAQLLGQWRRTVLEKSSLLFESGKIEDGESSRVADLERTLGKITLENEILKKGLSLSPRRKEGVW